MRHYDLEKKTFKKPGHKNIPQRLTQWLWPCRYRLTGQVTRGLGWKDLGHDRPRQSCFGQRRLDGPERTSPCEGEGKSRHVEPAHVPSQQDGAAGGFLYRHCWECGSRAKLEATEHSKC